MENKAKKLLNNTIVFAIGKIGSKLILFFLVPLYTTYMTREEYGTADLVFTVAELVLPFISIVIYDAVIRFGLSKNECPEDVLLVSAIVLGIGVVETLALMPVFALYEAIAPWKWYVSFYIVLSGIDAVNINYLIVKNKNIWYTVVCLIRTALMAVLNIFFLVWKHWGIKGYLAANVISVAVSVFLSFFAGDIFSELKKAKFRKPLFLEMVKFSLPLILNNISWWIVHSSDKVMLERMIDAEALGIYSVSAKIPALINVMISIFSQAWGISAVKEFENANDTRFYSFVFDMNVFLCFGASIFLNTIIKPAMKLYVGSDFYESWKYVPILLAAASFASIAYYYGSLYGAMKKSGRNMLTTFLAAAVNIIVNFFGIKLFGIYGAAIGTLAAYMIMAFTRMFDVGCFVRIKIEWKRLILTCLILLIQVFSVTFDFNGYAVSGLIIVVFLTLNRTLILVLVKKLEEVLKNAWITVANRLR